MAAGLALVLGAMVEWLVWLERKADEYPIGMVLVAASETRRATNGVSDAGGVEYPMLVAVGCDRVFENSLSARATASASV